MVNKFKYFLPIIIVIVISLLSTHRLFQPGYLSMQDDMHVFRLQQLDKCFQDKQIPCRYVPDAGIGYGYPLFNFYSPAPYYLAQFFHTIGFSFIDSIKATFTSIHLLAGVGMFLFASLFWGTKGAILSSIFFIFAPYRALDSFVRGAIAELMALSLLPWAFWSITNYLKKYSRKHLLSSTLILSLLFLSHNLLALVSLLILLPYITIIILNKKITLKKFLYKAILSLLPILFSLGISSFFLLPALLEKNLVNTHTMTQGYFYYVNHFATLKQLFFSHDWGFGASLWGPIDDMSFQVGYLHWLLPLIIFTYLAFKHKNKDKNIIKLRKYYLFFFILAIFSLFLTHNKSTFIWTNLPFMAYFQFPWRFLAIATFTLSFLSGTLITLLPKWKIPTLIIISISVILLNFNYFKEDIWFPNMTDNIKLSPENIIAQSGAGLKDYWPKYGTNFPDIYATQDITSPDGDIKVLGFTKKSNQLESSVLILSSKATLFFPLVYYPNWTISINGKPQAISFDDKLGQIKIELEQGTYQIELNYHQSTIAKFSNTLSLLSLLIILISFSLNLPQNFTLLFKNKKIATN